MKLCRDTIPQEFHNYIEESYLNLSWEEDGQKVNTIFYIILNLFFRYYKNITIYFQCLKKN